MTYGAADITRDFFNIKSKTENLRNGEFWAVNDVSFELKRGETLGIIGPNGSGKSTILKMLNGMYMPDKGRLKIKGRVGALIEVGAGFHPMLTGRENIYVNGAILGMHKKKIDRKFDEIVDFADIGDFLDSPVKHYSSGMYVRLGFAVAMYCEPDILLVDEVLAVGDRDFQIKCFRKMHELKKNKDISCIIVSHNEYVMRQWTKKCIVLNNGKVSFFGGGDNAISFYVNKLCKVKESLSQIKGSISKSGIIRKVTFSDSIGNQTNIVKTGDKIIIDFDYETNRKITNPIVGINFNNTGGLFTGLWSSYENVKLREISGKGTVRLTVNPFDLPVDIYQCAIVCCEEEESNVIEWKDLEQKLTVERPNNTRGLLKLQQTWEVISK